MGWKAAPKEGEPHRVAFSFQLAYAQDHAWGRGVELWQTGGGAFVNVASSAQAVQDACNAWSGSGALPAACTAVLPSATVGATLRFPAAALPAAGACLTSAGTSPAGCLEWKNTYGFYLGDGSSAPVDVVVKEVGADPASPLTDYFFATGEVAHAYAASSNGGTPWLAYFTGGPRQASLANNANQRFRLEVSVTVATNAASPMIAAIPVVPVPLVGATTNLHISAFDRSDLTKDFLTTELATAVQMGGDTGLGAPAGPADMTVKDAKGGVLSWELAGKTVGMYNQVVMISSTLAKVPVDFLIYLYKTPSFCHADCAPSATGGLTTFADSDGIYGGCTICGDGTSSDFTKCTPVYQTAGCPGIENDPPPPPPPFPPPPLPPPNPPTPPSPPPPSPPVVDVGGATPPAWRRLQQDLSPGSGPVFGIRPSAAACQINSAPLLKEPTPGYSGTSREVLGAANYVHAVARGSEIVIELAAEDPDSCTELTIKVTGMPETATLSSTVQTGTNAAATFTWPVGTDDARLDSRPDHTVICVHAFDKYAASISTLGYQHCIDIYIQPIPARAEQVVARFGCHMGLLWKPKVTYMGGATGSQLITLPGRFCFFDAGTDYMKSATIDEFCTPALYEDSMWHHAYVSLPDCGSAESACQGEIIVDGVVAKTFLTTQTPCPGGSATFAMGAGCTNNLGTFPAFDGAIDEVRIFSRPIDLPQVPYLMFDAARDKFPLDQTPSFYDDAKYDGDLVAYYRFNNACSKPIETVHPTPTSPAPTPAPTSGRRSLLSLGDREVGYISYPLVDSAPTATPSHGTMYETHGETTHAVMFTAVPWHLPDVTASGPVASTGTMSTGAVTIPLSGVNIAPSPFLKCTLSNGLQGGASALAHSGGFLRGVATSVTMVDATGAVGTGASSKYWTAPSTTCAISGTTEGTFTIGLTNDGGASFAEVQTVEAKQTAKVLDGADYADMSARFNVTHITSKEYSFGAWVRVDSGVQTPPPTILAFAKEDESGNPVEDTSIALMPGDANATNPGGFIVGIKDGREMPAMSSDYPFGPINDGQWFHVFMTCGYPEGMSEGMTQAVLYIDQAPVASIPAAPTGTGTDVKPSKFFVGGFPGGRLFSGLIDNLVVLDAAVTLDSLAPAILLGEDLALPPTVTAMVYDTHNDLTADAGLAFDNHPAAAYRVTAIESGATGPWTGGTLLTLKGHFVQGAKLTCVFGGFDGAARTAGTFAAGTRGVIDAFGATSATYVDATTVTCTSPPAPVAKRLEWSATGEPGRVDVGVVYGNFGPELTPLGGPAIPSPFGGLDGAFGAGFVEFEYTYPVHNCNGVADHMLFSIETDFAPDNDLEAQEAAVLAPTAASGLVLSVWVKLAPYSSLALPGTVVAVQDETLAVQASIIWDGAAFAYYDDKITLGGKVAVADPTAWHHVAVAFSPTGQTVLTVDGPTGSTSVAFATTGRITKETRGVLCGEVDSFTPGAAAGAPPTTTARNNLEALIWEPKLRHPNFRTDNEWAMGVDLFAFPGDPDPLYGPPSLTTPDLDIPLALDARDTATAYHSGEPKLAPSPEVCAPIPTLQAEATEVTAFAGDAAGRSGAAGTATSLPVPGPTVSAAGTFAAWIYLSGWKDFANPTPMDVFLSSQGESKTHSPAPGAPAPHAWVFLGSAGGVPFLTHYGNAGAMVSGAAVPAAYASLIKHIADGSFAGVEGAIDELWVWGRALKACELQTLADVKFYAADTSSGGYMTFEAAAAPSTPFKAGAWFKVAGVAGSHTIISQPGAFALGVYDGRVEAFVDTAACTSSPCEHTRVLTSSELVLSGQWYHAAMAYDGTVLTLSVNGITSQATFAPAAFPSPGSSTVYVGREGPSATAYGRYGANVFGGLLYDIEFGVYPTGGLPVAYRWAVTPERLAYQETKGMGVDLTLVSPPLIVPVNDLEASVAAALTVTGDSVITSAETGCLSVTARTSPVYLGADPSVSPGAGRWQPEDAKGAKIVFDSPDVDAVVVESAVAPGAYAANGVTQTCYVARGGNGGSPVCRVHTYSVVYDGAPAVMGTVTILPAAIDFQSSTVQATTLAVGVVNTVVVQLQDAQGCPVTSASETITVSVSGPSRHLDIPAYYGGEGRYTATYIPEAEGSYEVTAAIATPSGPQALGQPFCNSHFAGTSLKLDGYGGVEVYEQYETFSPLDLTNTEFTMMAWVKRNPTGPAPPPEEAPATDPGIIAGPGRRSLQQAAPGFSGHYILFKGSSSQVGQDIKGYSLGFNGDWSQLIANVYVPGDHPRAKGEYRSVTTPVTFADCDGGDSSSPSCFPDTDQGWMHVAATYTGTQFKLYVDSVLAETSYFGELKFAKNNGYWHPLSVGLGLAGQIDDVMLLQTALSQAEIAAKMHCPEQISALSADVAAYIPFNEGLGYLTDGVAPTVITSYRAGGVAAQGTLDSPGHAGRTLFAAPYPGDIVGRMPSAAHTTATVAGGVSTSGTPLGLAVDVKDECGFHIKSSMYPQWMAMTATPFTHASLPGLSGGGHSGKMLDTDGTIALSPFALSPAQPAGQCKIAPVQGEITGLQVAGNYVLDLTISESRPTGLVTQSIKAISHPDIVVVPGPTDAKMSKFKLLPTTLGMPTFLVVTLSDANGNKQIHTNDEFKLVPTNPTLKVLKSWYIGPGEVKVAYLVTKKPMFDSPLAITAIVNGAESDATLISTSNPALIDVYSATAPELPNTNAATATTAGGTSYMFGGVDQKRDYASGLWSLQGSTEMFYKQRTLVLGVDFLVANSKVGPLSAGGGIAEIVLDTMDNNFPSDCSGILFVSSAGETLPYYLDPLKGCKAYDSRFFVKTPPATTIQLFYGSGLGELSSDAAAVYEVSDSFEEFAAQGAFQPSTLTSVDGAKSLFVDAKSTAMMDFPVAFSDDSWTVKVWMYDACVLCDGKGGASNMNMALTAADGTTLTIGTNTAAGGLYVDKYVLTSDMTYPYIFGARTPGWHSFEVSSHAKYGIFATIDGQRSWIVDTRDDGKPLTAVGLQGSWTMQPTAVKLQVGVTGAHEVPALFDLLVVSDAFTDRGINDPHNSLGYHDSSMDQDVAYMPNGEWAKVATKSFFSPPARTRHSMVASGSSVYVFGGERSGAYMNDLWEFSEATQEWTLLTSEKSGKVSPPPRCDHTAVVYGNKMYVFGGIGKVRSTGYADLWEYDIAKGEWRELTGLVSLANGSADLHLTTLGGVFGHSAVLVGSQMVVFGGIKPNAASGSVAHGDNALSQVAVLDLELMAWSKLLTNSGPPAMHSHIATSRGGMMYITGGVAGGTKANTFAGAQPVVDHALVWQLDLGKGIWTELESSLSSGVFGSVSLNINDHLVLYNGMGGGRNNKFGKMLPLYEQV